MSDLATVLPQLLDDSQINQALDHLSPHLPGTPTSHTRLAHLTTLRNFLTWADIERRSVLHPDPTFTTDYFQHLRATLSERSVANYRSRLNHLYKVLHAQGVTRAGTNPFVLTTPPVLVNSEARDAYTQEELTQLVRHADPAWKAMLLLGAHAGLRKEEVLKLTWADLTRIPDGVAVYGRLIPDSRALRDTLNRYAQHSSQGSLAKIRDQTSPLFPPLAEFLLRRQLFTLCRRSKVPPLAWSGLRNHAILRTLAATGVKGVPQVIEHSEQRNTYVVRELQDEPVVQGPKRRRDAARV